MADDWLADIQKGNGNKETKHSNFFSVYKIYKIYTYRIEGEGGSCIKPSMSHSGLCGCTRTIRCSFVDCILFNTTFFIICHCQSKRV